MSDIEANPFDETSQAPVEADNLSENSVPKGIPGRNGGTLYPGANGQEKLGGRTPGKKNRATILNQFMGVKFKRAHPVTGVEEERTVEEWLEIAMISKAMMEHDVKAYQEIKDTIFGKNTDNVNLTGDVDLSKALNFNFHFIQPKDENKEKAE